MPPVIGTAVTNGSVILDIVVNASTGGGSSAGGVSITDYGARCDVKVAYTGAIASGSNELNDSSAQFTGADAGKVIWVNGDVRTIASVSSPTKVIVSGPAWGYSQASAVPYAYGTDDADAITSALAALPANGGTLYVPGLAFDSQSRDLRQRRNLTICGTGGKVGTDVLRGGGFTDGATATPASGLIYTGTGPYYLNFTDAVGITLDRLAVLYCNNNTFAGDLVIMGGSNISTPGYMFTINECTLGSISARPAIIQTANSILNLSGTVLFNSRDTSYGGAKHVIIGEDPDAATKGLVNGFSNAVNFYGGQIIDGALSTVLNPGESWNFNGVVFEPTGQTKTTPIRCSSGTKDLTLEACGFWDAINTGGPGWLITAGTNIIVRGCRVEVSGDIGIDASTADTTGLIIHGCRFKGPTPAFKTPTSGGTKHIYGLWFKGNTFEDGSTDPTSTFAGNANITLVS